MSTSILFALVFIGYSSVSGKMVTLKCPAGYHVKAWLTYEYEKTKDYLHGSQERRKIKKFMVCVLCKPQSEDNSVDLEICTDQGFTEAAKTSRQSGVNGVLRYQASSGHTVEQKYNFCADENHGRCHDAVCSANFSLSTDEEKGPQVDLLTFNECKNEIKPAEVREIQVTTNFICEYISD